MRADGRLRPLAEQLARLQQSEAVLAADGPAELARQFEQIIGRGLHAGRLLGVARVVEEGGVEVAVAGVAP